MPTNNVAMSFNCPNYSGLLFNKGNTKTPFSTLIGANGWRISTSTEFTTGQEYETAKGSQPAISEEASLTAPAATVTTRTQGTNVCQIFQESVYAADAKMSNMGTLSGINVAGQTANPTNELDFQIASKMAKIAQDIEYTALNGVYNKATSDSEINKSKGIVTATTSNVIDADGAKAGFWLLLEAQKLVSDANGDPNGLVALCNGTNMLQIQADALENNIKIITNQESINGVNVTSLITPYGIIRIKEVPLMQAGTIELANIGICHPVGMNVPEKGNFYLEELAKVGAGTKKHIFGQFGLDYGPEWYHAKITGLSKEFKRPENGILTRTAETTTPPATGTTVG